MGRIIAMGGGELRLLETLPLDQYIVNLTNKTNPKVLFIPTASKEAVGYIESFTKVYTDLGCITDTLYLMNNELSEEEIKAKILSSDIIYVGGGNTVFMLELWKEKKVDAYLQQALENNIILTGLSAGSICWFEYGHSDSTGENVYGIIKGLGFLKGIHCPHFNEDARITDFTDKMRNREEMGFAIEDNCAIEIIDDHYKIIKSNPNAKVYRIYYKNGTIIKDELNNTEYQSIEKLYTI